MGGTRRSEVARAIVGYLWKHPDAQDTLLGICQWWLPKEQMKSQTITVAEALSDLVTRGLIVERKGTDSQIHYRINRPKLQQVRAFLKETRSLPEKH